MTPAASERSELLEVGHIGKANGLRGDVTVVFTTNRIDERASIGSKLFDGNRWLEVVASRPQKNRWVLTLDGVRTREAAESLCGSTLWAEPIDDPEALYIHALIGCSVLDISGTDYGPVVSVISNPASDLLELESGRLVPLTFYVSHGDGKIVVDVPAGLLDDEAEQA